jgi:hypothetical protein
MKFTIYLFLPHPNSDYTQNPPNSLTKVRLPLNALKSVPSPSFQTELVNLKQAQFNLDAIATQINNFNRKIDRKE